MKEEINNLITETAERIVIDYANFSGRDSAHRAEFREAVYKHLKALLQAFLEAEIMRERAKKKDDNGTLLDVYVEQFEDGYNQAKEETIAHLRELLVILKR